MQFHSLKGRLPSCDWLSSKLQDCSNLLSQFRPHLPYISNTCATSHFKPAFRDTIRLKVTENDPVLGTIIWKYSLIDLFCTSRIFLKKINLTIERWRNVQKWRHQKWWMLSCYQHKRWNYDKKEKNTLAESVSSLFMWESVRQPRHKMSSLNKQHTEIQFNSEATVILHFNSAHPAIHILNTRLKFHFVCLLQEILTTRSTSGHCIDSLRNFWKKFLNWLRGFFFF
jgi:hypothetical protein